MMMFIMIQHDNNIIQEQQHTHLAISMISSILLVIHHMMQDDHSLDLFATRTATVRIPLSLQTCIATKTIRFFPFFFK